MKEVNASIITIGDELLIGQTIDTNSAFIAQELNKIGVWVRRRVAIADDREAILRTLAEEGKDSDIVIITGGLGPTADDITKPTLCEYFNTKLVIDEGALQNVKEIFQKLGRPMIDRNLKQAEVPESCTVLPNLRGTAPGMWFDARPPQTPPQEGLSSAQSLVKQSTANHLSVSHASEVDTPTNPPLAVRGAVYVSLPGVPHEMKGLVLNSVIPKLKESFPMPAVVHRTLLTAGIGESFLAERLVEFEAALPAPVKMAYLPSYGMVRLRLTGRSDERESITNEVDAAFSQLKSLVQDWMVIDEDLTVPEAVSRLLKQQSKTVGTAESCTGGYIAHLLTSLPGSSSIYNGSVVSYANDVKQGMLGVKEETLKEQGAVSEQTVLQMAAGACKTLHTDYAIATSGIMGPDGGSAEKPVGTVWVAVAAKSGKAKAQRLHFRFDRTRNIELAANNALLLLRSFLLEEEKE